MYCNSPSSDISWKSWVHSPMVSERHHPITIFNQAPSDEDHGCILPWLHKVSILGFSLDGVNCSTNRTRFIHFFFIACITIVNQAPLDEDWVHSPMVSECQHSCFFIGWSKLGGSLDILTGSMGPQTSKFSHSCNPYGVICMSYRTQKACASDAGFVGKFRFGNLRER